MANKMQETAERVAQELDETRSQEGYVKSRHEGGGYLPPIHRLKIPETRTQTAKVRWLHELGYEVKDIVKAFPGVRYQQIRNMVTTVPKRAAREDMPELKIELLEMEDEVEMLLGAALEEDFAKARKAGRKRKPREEDLDDEDYQEE